jgi:hypothetical protein
MGNKSADAPDYEAAALAEGAANKENLEQQTWANRPTQNNPWGTTSWERAPEWDPVTGQYINEWTQNQTLAEPLQGALENEMALMEGRSGLASGMMGDLATDYGTRMDWDQYGDPTELKTRGDLSGFGLDPRQRQLDYSDAYNIDDPVYGVQKAEDAFYDRGASRLDRRMGNQSEDLEVKLRGQGLQPGDQAYDRAMKDFGEERTDAYQALTNEAIMASGNEAQRMFGMQKDLRGVNTGEEERAAAFGNQARDQGFNERMSAGTYNQAKDLQQANYANQLRQQNITEGMSQRGQRLNEVNALISGQQVAQPSFTPFNQAGVAQAPQLLQAAGMQGQQAAANASADNAAFGNMMGGAASLGMMMSDRRLKRNIRRIGTKKGYPIYAFDYIWGVAGIGVMADEIPAEYTVQQGEYKMVNYGELFA